VAALAVVEALVVADLVVSVEVVLVVADQAEAGKIKAIK
jgi:hypothetical protein